MRTLLLGTDFAYNSNGDLRPIEINTNIGWDVRLAAETEGAINLTQFISFVSNNNFVKVTFIGGIPQVSEKFNEACVNLGVEYEFIETLGGITIPHVEDSDNHLIVRSAYDVSAIVDETYCKDKVNFLKLFQNENFGFKFAYMDETSQVISNITTIPNNNIHPNFILKARFPIYDREVYPKFFKVSNIEELNEVITNNVNEDYFLMEYLFNEEKLNEGRITIIRSLNILYPPTLESIPICAYKKYGNLKVMQELNDNSYDSLTHQISNVDRNGYLTGTQRLVKPKLLDTDLVVMADGSFKTGQDLQVGDTVKTIRLYENQPNITEANELRTYNVDYNELLSNSSFSTNVITFKKRIDVSVKLTTLNFSDETNWKDTSNSVYLIKRNNNVMWATIGEDINTQTTSNLQIGDILLLINVGNYDTISFNEKTVVSIQDGTEVLSGYIIGVQDEHIFLTITDGDSATVSSYIAVEHNSYCAPCNSIGVGSGGCDKMYEVCSATGACGYYSNRCLQL